MKRLIFIILMAFAAILPSFGQTSLNSKGDSILGNYESVQGEDQYKVKVTRNDDGTYKAQIYYVKDVVDPKTGKKDLDVKNPDKSLRNVPCDEIVLINGLKYNADKKQWDGAKIYDPQRGIKANVTASFQADGRLKLRATIMGIGETVYWTRIN